MGGHSDTDEKGCGGATRGSILGRESMLFGIGRRSGSVRAGMSAAGIGWIEVAPLRLRIAGVSVGGG